MKKKGFTLIELLAVIVILAILMLVAGSNVFGILDNARKGSFKTEFLELLNAAQTKAQIDIMNGTIKGTGASSRVCYTLTSNEDDAENDFKNYFNNKNNYQGSVEVTYTNGKLSVTGWLSSDQHIIEGKGDKIDTESDIHDIVGDQKAPLNCPK